MLLRDSLIILNKNFASKEWNQRILLVNIYFKMKHKLMTIQFNINLMSLLISSHRLSCCLWSRSEYAACVEEFKRIEFQFIFSVSADFESFAKFKTCLYLWDSQNTPSQRTKNWVIALLKVSIKKMELKTSKLISWITLWVEQTSERLNVVHAELTLKKIDIKSA